MADVHSCRILAEETRSIIQCLVPASLLSWFMDLVCFVSGPCCMLKLEGIRNLVAI
jgi:hypothetical protein